MSEQGKVTRIIAGESSTKSDSSQIDAKDILLTSNNKIVISPEAGTIFGNYRQPCDCPDRIREAMQRNMKAKCKTDKCVKVDSCPKLLEKTEKFLACYLARVEIMQKCFRGGDSGHKIQAMDKINAMVNCQEIFKKQCKSKTEPELQTVPETVNKPAPKPKEDEDFMKKMEEITGLTGVALIIYLIISECTRLFPLRNLVPIP